jgi:xanthine dehydrogenase YagS FAD-binding subunit
MDATSFDEAAKNASAATWVIAGGTDLLGTLKDEICREYPTTLVNIKTVADGAYIKEDGGQIKIGALTKLKDVADSALIKERCACLSQAAGAAASPTIRAMATIGGNICQMHRCWYFRCANNRFDCIRKGGSYCPAIIGDNRYHSIFGDQDGCYAPSSHDTAPALVALGATIATTKREVAAGEFFKANGIRSNVLQDGELVKEIRIPGNVSKSAFEKFALRKAIDFPLVNCAVATTSGGDVRVVLGAVYPTPLRMAGAEAAVSGGINEQSASAAGDGAVADAKPLGKNEYKVEIARTLVKRALLELA